MSDLLNILKASFHCTIGIISSAEDGTIYYNFFSYNVQYDLYLAVYKVRTYFRTRLVLSGKDEC